MKKASLSGVSMSLALVLALPVQADPTEDEADCWIPPADALGARAAWNSEMDAWGGRAELSISAPESFAPVYWVEFTASFGTTEKVVTVGPTTASALEEFTVELPMTSDMCWSAKQADYLTHLRAMALLVDDDGHVRQKVASNDYWYACDPAGVVLVDSQSAMAMRLVWSDSLRADLVAGEEDISNTLVFGPGE